MYAAPKVRATESVEGDFQGVSSLNGVLVPLPPRAKGLWRRKGCVEIKTISKGEAPASQKANRVPQSFNHIKPTSTAFVEQSPICSSLLHVLQVKLRHVCRTKSISDRIGRRGFSRGIPLERRFGSFAAGDKGTLEKKRLCRNQNHQQG